MNSRVGSFLEKQSMLLSTDASEWATL